MTEKIISLLKTGQFRKLENFINEHNFDIATPISCDIDDRSFDNCPFYNIVGMEGDKEWSSSFYLKILPQAYSVGIMRFPKHVGMDV